MWWELRQEAEERVGANDAMRLAEVVARVNGGLDGCLPNRSVDDPPSLS